MYDFNDEMINYEMLLLSYIWQEIYPMLMFSESQPWGGNAVLTVEKRLVLTTLFLDRQYVK